MDIGGLETVVANSAYVSARGSVDASAPSTVRDKKMRAKLKLPHISQCEHLRTQLDLDFQSLCLRQPIGKQLFQQFLEQQEAFAAAGGLWRSMEEYAAAEEGERPQKAQKTVNQFFDSASKSFCPFLEEKAIMRVKEGRQARAGGPLQGGRGAAPHAPGGPGPGQVRGQLVLLPLPAVQVAGGAERDRGVVPGLPGAGQRRLR
ncbi:unnamed protein product [Eretmochelys imbricata]